MNARGADVICVSSIDWDFIWQGHQEIMARLAAAGHRVLFVENTGVRQPRMRDLPRLRHRVRNWLRGINGFRRERQNLWVYSPLVLPCTMSGYLAVKSAILSTPAKFTASAILRPRSRAWSRASPTRSPTWPMPRR